MLITQCDLQLSRETGGGGCAIAYGVVDLDEEIDIPAPQSIIDSRPEQQHAGARPKRGLGLFSDRSGLVRWQAHQGEGLGHG